CRWIVDRSGRGPSAALSARPVRLGSRCTRRGRHRKASFALIESGAEFDSELEVDPSELSTCVGQIDAILARFPPSLTTAYAPDLTPASRSAQPCVQPAIQPRRVVPYGPVDMTFCSPRAWTPPKVLPTYPRPDDVERWAT